MADRLVPTSIIDLVDCELRLARKWRGRADAAQQELNQWILDGAKAGKQVVRLKCGDPYLFGRAQEEIDWLNDHDVPNEVIPGVTSAFSAPSAVGIPVTSRGYADRVTLLTARGAGDVDVRLPAFDEAQTYLWLMGVRTLNELATNLIGKADFPASLPVAVVSKAHHPEQRAIRTTLGAVAREVEQLSIPAPAVIVMGEVVCLASSQHFELDVGVMTQPMSSVCGAA